MAGLLIGCQAGLDDTIAALLRPAAARTSDTALIAPGLVVWTVHDGGRLVGAVTTGIAGTDGVIELVGGEGLGRWFPVLLGHVWRWAREYGADRLVARGRLGWARMAVRVGAVVTAMDGEALEVEWRGDEEQAENRI